jgi:hypothetical protein
MTRKAPKGALWHPTGADHLVVIDRAPRFATDERSPLPFYRGRYATRDAEPQALANFARMVAAVT